MRLRRMIWIAACLLLLVGACWLRRAHENLVSPKKIPPAIVTTVHSLSTAPNFLALSLLPTNALATGTLSKTNPLAYRLSNTSKSLDQLLADRHAILLANALIDTAGPLNLSIPNNLRASGNPGAYIVQARGPIDATFRAMLARAGAQIVSYIPNDAYLVKVSAAGANTIASGGAQSVIPYEPYYKIQSALLGALLENQPLPTTFNVAGYPNSANETETALKKSGWTVVSQQPSPFGEVFTVQGSGDVAALARLPEVQIVEAFHPRVHANDLSRAIIGVAADTQVATNYLGLDGTGVMVEVNDSGIDATHPDLANRVFGESFDTNFTGRIGWDLVDTNGHGTHVAGIIAGNGTKSDTVTDAQGSIMPGIGGQFRGMADKATLFSVAAFGNDFGKVVSDRVLQEIPAMTNALISNNSWNYGGDNAYDLAAASYDAATRDALPETMGSQPVLFVFSAGNAGGGSDNGYGGNSDTILSPATAKNVITVGALEEPRYITNIVTDVHSNQSAVWQPETDSSDQVAGFSSRGNVGIGYEGAAGRYKPDVVAPGTFVVSTRSSQWDTNAYYNPTNDYRTAFSDQVSANGENFYTALFVPQNAVQVSISVVPETNLSAPTIYLWRGTDPRVDPPDPPQTNSITAPGDVPLSPVGANWTYAISNNVSQTVNYTVVIDILTTNDLGDYLDVLHGLNDSIGPWYRYESGTSMSAAGVSGTLALMQQYLTNNFQIMPSPALMKAMLINGAHSGGGYDFQVQNAINFQGWGTVNLPDTLADGLTNQLNVDCGSFFVDQSPTNALATGDSHTYTLAMNPDAFGQYLPLKITLAWSDPPGDPAAAVKLVNSLELIVTNMDDPANPIVYYGNDIGAESTINNQRGTNDVPSYDFVNNVQNIIISPGNALLGTNYSITVLGRAVNVNAVSAQTNTYANNGPSGTYAPNVVQDYALVIASGEGEEPTAFSVTDNGIVSSPTTYQNITYVTTTNQPLFGQFVGANTPLINSVDTISFTTNTAYGVAQDTAGMTNQWHFYVVTNTGSASDFTNAGFITFFPPTLSLPRMGVYEDSLTNATRPEADIDLYVASGPDASGLTNLDPTVISKCINGTQIGASVGSAFYGASLGRGGTEFVVDTNSDPTSPQVYYIGVKSEDQMASEYGFIPIFSNIPFSQTDSNGVQTVNGQPVPATIPDGSPALAQPALAFGLALNPIQIQNVVVTNVIQHQNFGDLIGVLTHGEAGIAGTTVVLNNHDSFGNTFTLPVFVYNDNTNAVGIHHSDGPGSLNDYVGQDGFGVWIMSEADTSLNQTGSLTGFTMRIDPHVPLDGSGKTNHVDAHQWSYDFIDVPVGVTNLTIFATNLPSTSTPPIQLYVQLNAQPDTNNYDKMALLVNGTTPGPGNSISIGPSDVPPIQPGRYWIGIYNPDTVAHDVYLAATLAYGSASNTINFDSTGGTTILDDAVTYSTIFVTNTLPVASINVGIAVQHPRISDLVFHLISPDGTRVLLMENRGGTSTNGAGGNSNFATASDASVLAGPILNTNNGHYYYLLQTNTWTASEAQAVALGGHLVTINDANENSWVLNTFSLYGGVYRNLWIGFYDPAFDTLTKAQGHGANFVWVDGEPITYANWASPEPNNGYVGSTREYWTSIYSADSGGLAGQWNDVTNTTFDGGSHFNSGVVEINTLANTNLYLVFTEDTNLTTTPIKYAVPPFDTNTVSLIITNWATNLTMTWFNSFEGGVGDYGPSSGQYFAGGWFVDFGDIDALTNGTFSPAALAYDGGYYIDLNGGQPGGISTNVPTIPGVNYTLSFAYTKNPDKAGSAQAGVIVSNKVLAVITAATNNSWSNLGWRTISYGFTASSSSTHIAFQSTNTPGLSDVLLDAVGLATNSAMAVLTTNYVMTNYYVLPEQSLNVFTGEGAYGLWTLEIQDDRAGAGLSNVLTGWQLQFTFANTNAVPASLNGGEGQTNSLRAGGIAWYQITVPTNATIATNLLLFADAPLNVWFSTNSPPTITNSAGGDIDLIPNSTGNTAGPAILYTNNISWPYIVPGGTYYLGVQNTNSFTVNYGIEVDFGYPSPPLATNVLGFGPITTDGTNLFVGGYLTNAGNSIFSVTPTNDDPALSVVYSNLTASAWGLAVNGTNLYWINPTNPGGCAIFIGDTSGSSLSTYFTTTIVSGSDIASDGIQLFVPDEFGGLVYGVPFNFSTENQIGGNRYPNGLAREHPSSIAAANGIVYIADSGKSGVIDPQVVSIATNGTAFTTNYHGAPLVSPSGITVSGGALFVADPGATNTVWMIPTSTNGTPMVVAAGAPFRVIDRITYLNHTLYVTDNDTNGANGLIYYINLPNPSAAFGAISVNTNGVTLNWTAPIYDEFQVQWTDDLAQPWHTVPQIITSSAAVSLSAGTFIFIDDGSQTAPLSGMRFYRLVEILP